MKGLDPRVKAARVANYITTLRKELLQLSRACGVPNPSQITTDDFEILDGCFGTKSASERFGYPDQSKR